MANLNRKHILIASAALGAIILGLIYIKRRRIKTIVHHPVDINQSCCREDDAIARMASIKDISYELKLVFTKVITGTIKIGLYCLDVNLPVWIDYTGDPIQNLQINSIPQIADFSSPSISLTSLNHGKNEVSLDFTTQLIEKPGWNILKLGSHSYYYSNFKGFAAHNIFPCIDQPNFQAVWKISLSILKTFKAICSANMDLLKEDGKLCTYTYSSKCHISSFSLNIGEFWSYNIGTDQIVSTIYYPQELQNEVTPHLFQLKIWIDEILLFLRTTAALQKLEQNFNIIVAPEINHFKNTCLVSTDFFSKPRAEQKLHIFYSLASQWFEHNISYEWWDDIWILESISQLLAHIFIQKTEDDELKSLLIIEKGKFMKRELVSYNHNLERSVDRAPDQWEGSGVKYGYILYQIYQSLDLYLIQKLLRELISYQTINETSFFTSVKQVLGARREIIDLKVGVYLNRMISQTCLAILLPVFKVSDHYIILKLNVTQVAEPHLPFKVSLLSLSLPEMTSSVHEYELKSRTETILLNGSLNKMQWCMLLDSDDIAWGLVENDRRYISKLRNNIYRIPRITYRLIIWRNLYLQVFRQSLYWMDFLNMAISEINYERNEFVLNYILSLCVDIFDSLPVDPEHEFSNRVLATILKYQVRCSKDIIQQLVNNPNAEKLVKKYGLD